jgi:hypothetical protein
MGGLSFPRDYITNLKYKEKVKGKNKAQTATEGEGSGALGEEAPELDQAEKNEKN